MTGVTNGAAHAADLLAHAMTAMRAGDEDSARALVREADRLTPPAADDRPEGWVPNGVCLFGRAHAWLVNGGEVAGIDVALCSRCGIVNGTGVKIDPTVGGGLFTALDVTRAHSAPASGDAS